jgi:hypothetical protein
VPSVPLPHLRRVRWAIRATLLLGVAASVAANILHANPNPISQMIAAWPPLALLLTVELISRVPMHRRSLAAVRLFATTAIAGIAAWVSYWHMAGVVARYGESGTAQYLLPFSVDGLVIVASVSLVELAGRIRVLEQPLVDTPGPDGAARVPASRTTDAGLRSLPAPGMPTMAQFAQAAPGGRSARSAPRRTTPTRHAANAADNDSNAPRQRRPVAETAALAAQIEAERPDMTHAELAAQLGISTSRLRAVRREVALEPAA